MKEKIHIPGPARAMYGTYLGVLAVVLYTGFYLYHPFISGWRYPWSMGLIEVFNFYLAWILVLTAFVYLYYADTRQAQGLERTAGHIQDIHWPPYDMVLPAYLRRLSALWLDEVAGGWNGGDRRDRKNL